MEAINPFEVSYQAPQVVVRTATNWWAVIGKILTVLVLVYIIAKVGMKEKPDPDHSTENYV